MDDTGKVQEFLIAMIGASPMEWTAVVCGVINVGLIIRRSIWNYPFGFVMVVLYALIFWDHRLYSDALLQVYFFGIQIYGLWVWLNGRADDGRITVAPLPRQWLFVYLGATAGVWLALAAVMTRYTDAAAPYWDAAIAALSVTAQLLMSRRHAESWLLWIMVDCLAIGLFFSRDLAPTAVLYGLFLVLAITGLVRWRRAPHDRIESV